nr:hypothetical protein [uncultured Carboxylicivirga sp.]
MSVLLFFVNANSQAQSNMTSTLSKNNFYVDAGGHFAGQASINLERLFYTGEKTAWYARAGLGGAGIIMANGGLGGLGAVTMLTGRGNKHFEMNCGAFIGKESDDNDIFVFPLIDLGYRYQKPEGGFIFRAKLGFLGLGIGLGYAF